MLKFFLYEGLNKMHGEGGTFYTNKTLKKNETNAVFNPKINMHLLHTVHHILSEVLTKIIF